MITVIDTYTDQLIGAPYVLAKFNARVLSGYLKSSLKKQGIDYNQFNAEYKPESERDDWGMDVQDAELEKNPPQEIYEYQNFFLMEKAEGELVLLDGFRRLLWYNAPDTDILVRIYKKSDLTDDKILYLLVYLNHFKFFSRYNDYHDRGFALLLHTVFGLHIGKYREAFAAYLTLDQVRNDYSSGGKDSLDANLSVKERILNPMFTSDVKFIECLNEMGYVVNKYTGAMAFQERQKTDMEFSAAEFDKHAKANPALAGLMEKHQKDPNERKWMNQILEIYENIFALMRGEKTEKSYAEKVQDCKALSESIKKDKNWTKLTGVRDRYAEDIMEQMIKDKKADQLKFQCVIFPNDNSYFEYGLNEEVKFLGVAKSRHWAGGVSFAYGIRRGENTFRVDKGFMTETKFRNIHTPMGYASQKIDLFVNIPKSEVEKAKKVYKEEMKKRSDEYYRKQEELKAKL